MADRAPAGASAGDARDAGDAGDAVTCTVVQVTAAEVPRLAEPLFRDYGRWAARGLHDQHGVVLTDADLERHHEQFRAETPALLGPRGRLLVARLGPEPVGVAALKPIDGHTGEVKRVYVRPEHHGYGIGRLLLRRLLLDAGTERYRTLRLETADFMTAAIALYRSLGFVDTAQFDGSETAGTALHPFARYMELRLDAPGAHPVVR